jgi:hypothetical protein
VRDGEKGPVAIELVTRRVQTRMERKRTGPAEWLVITRRPLTDERMFGIFAYPPERVYSSSGSQGRTDGNAGQLLDNRVEVDNFR